MNKDEREQLQWRLLKSLFMAQNVRYLIGRPSHVTLPFEYVWYSGVRYLDGYCNILMGVSFCRRFQPMVAMKTTTQATYRSTKVISPKNRPPKFRLNIQIGARIIARIETRVQLQVATLLQLRLRRPKNVPQKIKRNDVRRKNVENW